MRVEYFQELWWCNTHERPATHLRARTDDDGEPLDMAHVCDPKLGGIMLPCSVVDLTGIAEIEK